MRDRSEYLCKIDASEVKKQPLILRRVPGAQLLSLLVNFSVTVTEQHIVGRQTTLIYTIHIVNIIIIIIIIEETAGHNLNIHFSISIRMLLQ